MKKMLLLIILSLVVICSKAQVSYFGNIDLNLDKLEVLKKTTTLFTLQYSNYDELEKFDQAIRKTWTITPYKIIKPEELSSYDTVANYSYFYFDGYSEKVDSTSIINIVYALKLISPPKKGKKKNENVFATVTLFADKTTNFQAAFQTDQAGFRNSWKSSLLNNLYNHARFYNWSPGFLAGYLKQINDGLMAQENRYLDFQFYNKVRLPTLAKETLYLPEYIKQVFSSMLITLPTSGIIEEPYNYKLKFVTKEVLDSLILNKDAAIKYVVYTQRANDKIISIYDSKDDKLIYQRFYPKIPNFEMNDLSEIKKVIKSIN